MLALAMSLIMAMSVMTGCGGDKTINNPDTTKPNQNQTEINAPDNGSETTGNSENAGTDSTEPEVETYEAYLTENDDLAGFVKVDSLNRTHFYVPEDAYNNSVDMMTYMMTLMSMSFASEEIPADQLAEMQKIVESNIKTEVNSVFALMNPTTLATIEAVTYENAEGLKIEDITTDNLNDILNSMGEATSEGAGEVVITEPEQPNSAIGETETSTDSEVSADTILIAPNPNSENTEDESVDSVLMAPVDETVADTETADTEETGEVEPAEYIVDKELVRTEDKVIFSITCESEIEAAEGNVVVNLNGFVTIVIKDGYVSVGIALVDANEDSTWAEIFARSLEIDVNNPGTELTDEDMLNGLFGADEDVTEETSDETIEDATSNTDAVVTESNNG